MRDRDVQILGEPEMSPLRMAIKKIEEGYNEYPSSNSYQPCYESAQQTDRAQPDEEERAQLVIERLLLR